jgi:hypothetical protein
MKYRLLFYCFALVVWLPSSLGAQEDLLSLIRDSASTEKQPVKSSFKTTRVVNFQSLENTHAQNLDIKISHRFGFLNLGIEELFGLDAATIRLGAEYGITDRLMVGFGRSSFEKTLDTYFKWKTIQQTSGKGGMPVTVSLFGSAALRTFRVNTDLEDKLLNRMYYTGQVIVGSKISEEFSLQLSPTIVHRNLTATTSEKNDVFGIGAAGRFKVSKRISLNAEYMYLLPDQVAPGITNSLSIGFDIETGGHVFQLHLTNSTAMIEKGFITETTGDWGNGDIHFGFNISRVFDFSRKNKTKAE